MKLNNELIGRAQAHIRAKKVSDELAHEFFDAYTRLSNALNDQFVQWAFRIGASVNGVQYVAYAPQKVEQAVLAYVSSNGADKLSVRASEVLRAIKEKKKRRHLWRDSDHAHDAKARVLRLAREIIKGPKCIQ